MSFMTLPIVCLFAVCLNIWAFCYGRNFFFFWLISNYFVIVVVVVVIRGTRNYPSLIFDEFLEFLAICL